MNQWFSVQIRNEPDTEWFDEYQIAPQEWRSCNLPSDGTWDNALELVKILLDRKALGDIRIVHTTTVIVGIPPEISRVHCANLHKQEGS